MRLVRLASPYSTDRGAWRFYTSRSSSVACMFLRHRSRDRYRQWSRSMHYQCSFPLELARAASVLCCRELGRCEGCTRRIRPRWRRLDPAWSFRILCCALDACGGATFGPAPAHASGLSASAAFAGCDPDWVRRVPRGPCWISVSAAWTASTMGWTIADRHHYTRSSC